MPKLGRVQPFLERLKTSKVYNDRPAFVTTAGGLARFEWSVAEGGDAIIVELGGNDLLRGIDPASSRANLDGILTKAGEREMPALITGMQAPLNYGQEYKDAFDSMYPDLAEKHRACFRNAPPAADEPATAAPAACGFDNGLA